MARSRILITGGAGFLGHYLVQALVEWNRRVAPGEQIEVVIYENWIRGAPGWLKRLPEDAVAVREYDVTNPLPHGMEDFDWIIHAASIASPTFYRKHPIETMDANVTGIRSLLDYCVQRRVEGASVQGLLFFSSSEIYGDPDPENIPTSEDYRGNVSCVGPRACYDESKRYGETLCVNFARAHGVPVKVARPFNNYGPGLRIDDRRVIPDFARDILADRDLVLLSDGSPTRTFCYVTDAVVGYLKTLVRGRPGEAYNIGADGPEISMVELAERMVSLAEDLFGYRGRVVRGSSQEPAYLKDNPIRRRPSLEKAQRELDYSTRVGLGEGLRRSLLWYAGHGGT